MSDLFNNYYTINCNGNLISLASPKVMGVLNVTPDSFYDGGTYIHEKAVLTKVEQMLNEGASFIDVGGVSTKPGSKLISEKEEWKRLKPALEAITKEFPNTYISLDTYNAGTARKGVQEYGVCMINDISGGSIDSHIFDTIAELQVPYIIMHIQGLPENMQDNPQYNDFIKDIFRYFSKKLYELNHKGVNDVIIDPGFGFGKTIDHNYQLLDKLDSFRMLERPILAGLSRKSMIFKVLESNPDDALNGTVGLNMLALMKGANILRVHDVKPATDLIRIYERYRRANATEFAEQDN